MQSPTLKSFNLVKKSAIIGCKNVNCPNLYLDTWKIEETEECDTGHKILKDTIAEEYKIEHSEEERYLGDLITTDGKNAKNILARKSRGIGIIDKIFNYLNDVFFGPFFFQAAVMLRTSLLLSSILVNSESWYNVSNSDIQELESVDNMLHRRILETPRSTPISLMHLELGTLLIRYVIKSHRLLFLQYILKQDKDTLMYRFFDVQSRYPQKGDWVLQIKEDLKEVNLNMTFDEISKISDYSFQSKVKKAISQSAFKWLISEKNKPRSNTSKGSNLKYSELKIQDYFLPNDMSNAQCNLLFSLRSRMVPVKCNFRHSYNDLSCPVCMDPNQLDNQIHILTCKTLVENENMIIGSKLSHDDILSTNVKTQSAL